MRALLAVALAGALLLGCAQPSHLALPRQQAWFEDQQIDYITTDISDAAMARALGVNYAPRLADALPPEGAQAPGPARTVLERVYKFMADEQASIFASVPRPVGPASLDTSYSPLWLLVEVRWQPGLKPRLLTSEEALLAAEERGELTLRRSRIVVNCPVLRSERGGALRDLRELR
ncbi:DUF7482 domain-containing protein [Paucibacter soli]|uniref:DUF7482 domain-containing protein n=1 Tax=Paucibacter soli TaxID=3133433 RepID=UPI00309F8003